MKNYGMAKDVSSIPSVLKFFLTMKLIFLLVCGLGLLASVAEESYAQNTKLTFALKNTSIKNVLAHIEHSSEFSFMYENNDINVDSKLDFEASNETIDVILERLFSNEIDYRIIGRHIILFPAEERAAGEQVIYSQQRTVSGTVTDESGEPLPGVTVIVKGTSQGSVTNANGGYRLSDIPENATLVFSFVGMRTKEVTVGNQTTINVTMKFDAIGIEEVVAVGYGTQKRSDVTGAISSVEVEELEGLSIKSIDQTLQGRVAGLNFIQNSGMPGAASVIRIRGGNSIQGGNEPLYVIDGVPVYASPSSTANSLSGLNTISTSDIESIEVLKDASATAIYGSRGGNGVILITTKKGKKGEDRINYNGSFSMQTARKKYEMLNAAQYEKMANEALVNEGGEPYYDESLTPPTTDWQDLALRTAPTQNHEISFSGGNDKTQYHFSLGYLDQEGIIHNSNFERLSARSNINRKLSKSIEIGTNITWNKVSTNRISGAVLGGMLSAPPNISVNQPDGSYTKYYPLRGSMADFNNPMAYMNDFVDFNQSTRFLGSSYLNINLAENLVFKILGGMDAVNSKRDYYNPQSTITGFRVGGAASVSSFQKNIWLNENTLNYSLEENGHKLNLLIGFTQQGSRYESVGASAQEFSNDVLQMNDLGAGLEPQRPSSLVSEWLLHSYLARINYGFHGKYLITFTGRYDGSSRFGANNRFGFFPSGAIAWRAIEESFIKDLGVFSNLKLRLSYGLTGNQDGIGTYPGVGTMGDVRYSFNENPVAGMLINKPANKDLKWETTTQANLGLEMGFLDNRLSVSVDLYNKRTDDLLLNVTIPSSSGFTNAIKNVGGIRNRGMEFTLGAVPFTGEKFSWNFDFNVATNKNEIVDLGGKKMVVPANRAPNDANILLLNEPLGVFYGYKTDGTFNTFDEIMNSAQPSAKPGDVKFVNQNDDNIINEDDRVVLGNAQPKFFGGFNNQFQYRGFDLSLFLRFSYGNDIYNLNRFTLQDLTGKRNNTVDVLDRWTEDNRETDVPRASSVKTSNISTDREVEDGSYLRLKSVQIGYNFSPEWFDGLFDNLRFYITGENLLTLTNYSGYDPEVSAYGASNVKMGYDGSTYPSVKTLKMGLNLSF